MPDYSKDHIVLNIYNSPMTKADLDPDTAYERQLHRLDCFFYVKGKTNEPCVYYQMVEIDDEGQSTVAFYVNDLLLKEIIPSGQTCDVFVIANHPGTPTFEAKQQGTDIVTLGEYILDMTQGTYDGIEKPFVMTGSAVAVKGRNSTVTADVALKRVAAKVTMTVKIPKSITVNETEKMCPVLTDNEGNLMLKSSFRHGTSKSLLYGDMVEDEESHIITDKISYELVSETETEYVYECGIPFYTYARAWERGSDHAAYMTFEMPWGHDENEDGKADNNFGTYYYQILINGGGRCFERNCWYDMTVRVGILGSTVEIEPKTLEDLTYYILDWTTEPESDHMGGGDRHEDVKIENYTYLEVKNPRLEIDNASTGVIHFNASHNVDVEISKKVREVEGIPGLETPNNVGAFYVNCGGDSPVVRSLDITVDKNLTIDNEKGKLTFTHEIDPDAKIYSPVYVYATIWLETDGEKGMSDDEKLFSNDIVIVQYPAMYIQPDLSNPYSIYVNNVQHSNQSTDYTFRAGGTNHNLGHVPGVSGNWGTKDSYMYTVTVSTFKGSDTFKAHDGKYYPYIIGDPRQRTSDLELDDDSQSNVASNWVSSHAVDVDANGNVVKNADGEIQYTQRSLQYYYPTQTEGNSFQIVSPKFKIVSYHSSGWGQISSKGAEMRCATFQEDGYPAGRWRLPTEAEIMFVIDLQKAGVISDIFAGSSQYYTATEVNNTTRYKISCPDNGTPSWNTGTTGSVRCVYDEWFWGSDREANKNPNYNENYNNNGVDNNANHANNEYLFTWGDKKIW